MVGPVFSLKCRKLSLRNFLSYREEVEVNQLFSNALIVSLCRSACKIMTDRNRINREILIGKA